MKKKIVLICGAALLLIFIVIFVFFSAFSFIHPRLQNFSEYESLYNWDLPHHAEGDFDLDGQTDLVTFTGCAFLSSVSSDNIPEEKKCLATGIVHLFIHNPQNYIGQKFIDTNKTDLTLGGDLYNAPTYAYLGKSNDGIWRIYSEDKGKMRIWEIKKDQLLIESQNVPFNVYLDRFLYQISKVSFGLLFYTTEILKSLI